MNSHVVHNLLTFGEPVHPYHSAMISCSWIYRHILILIHSRQNVYFGSQKLVS